MKNLIILCGGQSGEHEVSLQSALSICSHVKTKKYTPMLIGIDKSGKWRWHENLILEVNNPSKIHINPEAEEVFLKNKNIKEAEIDIVFPIIHGSLGEDGAMQGLLRTHNIPFVGSSVLGSAVCMDKDVAKRLLKFSGIPTAKWLCCYKGQELLSFEQVKADLGVPFFVKPANMGSSVGVCKCSSEKEYESALYSAWKYDTKVLIEEYICGREIELAVLGNEEPRVSLPGEIIPSDEFYSYEAKYIDSEKTKLLLNPELEPRELQKMQYYALRAFQALECAGMARVDFFLGENEDIYINEINTLPGFTSISMYPKLWELSGIPYAELIEELLELAINRHYLQQDLKINYL